jgi:hypothetical protein
MRGRVLPGEYQFKKRAGSCRKCGREFQVSEEYFSGLILEAPVSDRDSDIPEDDSNSEAESGEALPFQRLDLCSSCWDGDPEAAGKFFSFWKAVVPEEVEDGNVPLAKLINVETIYGLFRQLEGHAELQQQKFRFILALMLMRKKRLKFSGLVKTEGGEKLVLEDKDEGLDHQVLDPGLAEEEIDSLREQIDLLLGGPSAVRESVNPDLNPAPDPAPAQDASGE